MCLTLQVRLLMAPLRYAAKLDPYLSLDVGLHPRALHPGAIQGKEGIKFCHLATLDRNTEAAQHFVIAAAAKKDEVHNEHAYEATFNAAVAYRYDRVSG